MCPVKTAILPIDICSYEIRMHCLRKTFLTKLHVWKCGRPHTSTVHVVCCVQKVAYFQLILQSQPYVFLPAMSCIYVFRIQIPTNYYAKWLNLTFKADSTSSNNLPVADPGGARGPCTPPGPMKISHKKDGHQRWPHRFHVSRAPLPGRWIRYCLQWVNVKNLHVLQVDSQF